jgi:hypothetical protein
MATAVNGERLPKPSQDLSISIQKNVEAIAPSGSDINPETIARSEASWMSLAATIDNE